MDQHQVSVPKHQQFGLKSLFVVTAILGVQLALTRLLGWFMVPVCVHATATAVILVWTNGRTWTGTSIGFTLGFLLAAFVATGFADIRAAILLALLLSTVGGWIG